MSKETNLQPLLVRASGPLAGARCPIRDQVIRIGRGPQNDVVIADTAKVSVRHCEIRREGSFFRVYDLNSTNGTYVNGERVTEATLESSCSIRLGADGPELTFILNDGRSEAEDGNAVNLNQTIADPPPPEFARLKHAHFGLSRQHRSRRPPGESCYEGAYGTT